MAGELILIIEDNERNMKLVRDLLTHSGYHTLEARNAEDGLELATTHRPNLILMDIQLPGLDGVAALGRLRADTLTAGIPTIALTAFAMKDDRTRFLEAGFDGYLVKPINVREFVGQVNRILEAAHG
jgi:two-component system cell cycle response regulator DivK